MPLVNAKCTNCGANLQVDNTKDAAICQYCGSAYIVEKAINNYNTVNHIHASVVNIYGGNSADFVIRGGVLEKYNGAATHVVIPNSVRCIGEEAFMDTYVEFVSIPDSVKSIKVKAFYNCKELREIDIPNSVTEIQGRAFFNCWSLQRVVLPSCLTDINAATFVNCINLSSINIPKSVNSIANTDSLSTYYDKVSGHRLVSDDYMWYSIGSFENCPSLVNVNFENQETAERLSWYFPHSPIGRKKRAEVEEQQKLQKEKEKEQQKQKWRRAGVCDLCGGSFSGLIAKKCSKCGKSKQY